MPSKYDTNPLDPDFPEKARAAAAGEETRTLPYRGGETQQFPPSGPETAPTHEQRTRRFAEPDVQAYSSPYAPPYNGQNVPTYYQQANFSQFDQAKKRRVKAIGLPENIVIAACYFPFWIGLVASLIVLLLSPKDEPKVRFHAAQGLGAYLGILLITMLLNAITGITGGSLGTFLFWLAWVTTTVIFTIRAWQGKPIHIPALDDLTNWLDEKIGPVK